MPNLATDSKERIDRYIYEYRNGYYLTKNKGLKEKVRYYYMWIKMFIQIIKIGKDNKGKRLYVLIKGLVQGWRFKPLIETVDKSS